MINERVHRDIPIVVLFRYPTIRALASYIAGEHRGDDLDLSTKRGETRKSFLDAAQHIGIALQHSGDPWNIAVIARKRKLPDEHSQETRIAVVGMAIRCPGAANVEEFWSNLKNGVESITIWSDEELREGRGFRIRC